MEGKRGRGVGLAGVLQRNLMREELVDYLKVVLAFERIELSI